MIGKASSSELLAHGRAKMGVVDSFHVGWGIIGIQSA